MEKRCPGCGETKPHSEFNRQARSRDGCQAYCRPCSHERSRNSYLKHRDKNRPKRREYMARWREENSTYARDSDRRRRADNPQYRLTQNFGSNISHCLRGAKNKLRWDHLLGYDRAALVRRMEAQFRDGMSWDNYGEWHVDHIIPKSWFYYESPHDWQFKVCWSLANLQPLWAEDNRRKSDGGRRRGRTSNARV